MVLNKSIFVSERCVKIGAHTGMCWEMVRLPYKAADKKEKKEKKKRYTQKKKIATRFYG